MRKTYDFNARTMPCGIVGRPRELAWPCKILTVAKPIVNPGLKDLNPFERCILKLLALRSRTPRELAEETCLPPDLIAVILLRLFDRNKIDKDYRLTPDTLAEIENHDASSEIEYRTIYQFVDCLGNKKLNEISGHLKAEEINDDGSIRKGADSIFLHYLLKRDIPVESDAEFCILRVRMILQKNGDWRILNPFGNGWSKMLEASYQQFLNKTPDEAEAFSQWQEANSRRFTKKKTDYKPEPYDTEENRSRYPQLIAALNRRNHDSGENDVDVYAALEWALFYSLRAVDLKQVIQILTIDSIQNNETRLTEAASNILGKSLQYSDLKKIHVFLPAPEKIKGFQHTEKAEMQVVLPLAILAKGQLPLYLVANKYPDFLQRIFDLNQRRNAQKHGKSHQTAIYGAVDFKFMQQVIAVLLPSILFSDSEEIKNDEDTIFDMKFSARRSLQEFFGVAQFNNMDNILQEYLIQTELFLQSNTGGKSVDESIDALACITHLYAAAECAFRPLIEDNHELFTSFEAIEAKTKKAGLGELSAALKTIRPDLLQKTLDGNDQTLGASVVVWLLQAKLEYLKQIAIRIPSFLADISRLLTLRGHGNQICMIHESELRQICTSIYKVIDIIKED